MAQDILGETLEQEPTTALDETRRRIRDQAAERQRAMQANVYVARDSEPDQAAHALKLATTLGLPVQAVTENLKAAQAAADERKIPFKAIQEQSPKLAEWLGENAENAAVSKDDLEQLGLLEWLTTAPSRAVTQGIEQVRVGKLRSKQLFQPLTQGELDQLNASKFHMDHGGALGASASWFRGAITGGARLLPNIAAGTAYASQYGAVGAAMLGTGGAVLGGVTGGPAGIVPGAVGGGSLGYRAGATYGGLKFGFELEAGLALDEMLTDPGMRDANGKPLDWQTARLAAMAVGAINAPIELFQLGTVLKQFGLNKVTGAGTRQAVKVALQSPTIRAALAGIAKDYAVDLAKESSTEAIQRAVTVLGEEMAKESSGAGIPRRTAAQVRTEVVNEFVGAVQSFALTGAGGAAVQTGQAVTEVKHANATRDYYTALGEGITASKTAERAPGHVQKLIEKATADGPIEHTYVDRDTWVKYWQDQGVDPAEMAAEVTGREDALQAATEGNTKLEIPTARYAVTLAATPHNAFFAEELRLGDPDAMNAREDEALHAASLKDEPAEIAQRDDQTQLTPLEELTQRLASELEQGGRFTPRSARQQAELYRATVGQLASDLGVDPLQAIERAGLRVNRQTFADSQLEQQRQERAAALLDPTLAEATGSTDTPGTMNVPRETDPNLPTESNGLTPGADGAQTEAPHGDTPGADRAVQGAGGAGGDTADGVSESRPSAKENEPHRIKPRKGEPANALEARRADAVTKLRDTRRAAHFDQLFDWVLSKAPEGIDESALRQEFDLRVQIWDEATSDYRDSGQDPLDLLRAIARHGGIGGEAHGGLSGERRWLMENTVAGRFRGIQLFAKKARDNRGVITNGLPFDEMVTALRQDARFHWIESTDDLIEAIDEAMRNTALSDDATYPGSDTIGQDLGIDVRKPWWQSNLSGAFTAEVDREGFQDSQADGGDVSFDPLEFDSSLGKVFLQLRQDLTGGNPAGTQVDLLDTGEAQPRLPGAEDVRDQEITTPELEAPFALTSEVSTAKKGKQQTLFQPAPAAGEAFDRWFGKSAFVNPDGTPMVLYHGTTKAFDAFDDKRPIYLTNLRDEALDWGGGHIQPDGSFPAAETVRVIDAYVSIQNPVKVAEWDDFIGWTKEDTERYEAEGYDGAIFTDGAEGEVMALAFHPTQVKSASENAGTFDPNSPVIYEQPAYHGTPHTFEMFSLDAIGTGEGAQVYGWGLYFASRKDVAEQYRLNLSGGMGRSFDARLEIDGQEAFRGGGWDSVSTSTDADGAYHAIDTSTPEGRTLQRGLLELHTRLSYRHPGPTVIADVRHDLEVTLANWTESAATDAKRMADLDEQRAFPNVGFQEETDLLAAWNAAAERWRHATRVLGDAQAALVAIDHYGDRLNWTKPPKPGRTFTVDLTAEEDSYLDWDKPWAEQSERVLRALELGDVARPNRGPHFTASLSLLVADTLDVMARRGATELERTEAASLIRDMVEAEQRSRAGHGEGLEWDRILDLVYGPGRPISHPLKDVDLNRIYDIATHGLDTAYIEHLGEAKAQVLIDDQLERWDEEGVLSPRPFTVETGDDEEFPYEVKDSDGRHVDSYSDEDEATAAAEEETQQLEEQVRAAAYVDARNLIDWEGIRQDVREELGLDRDSSMLTTLDREDTGEAIYKALERRLGDPEQVSRFLAALGVNGVRYLDGMSRKKGGGTHNFVVFDDQLIKVVEYDQPVRGYVDTPAFRAWFRKSQVTDAAGEPRVVYHGTNRLDRFGPLLRKSRATSGPMPFFTGDAEIASNYAKNKADTSLGDIDQGYETWFRFPVGRTQVNLDRAWFFLSAEQRQRIGALAPRVGMTDDASDIVLKPEGHDHGTGGYDHHIREAGGNHLAALVEEWLNSGTLHGDERSFFKVLELAGAPADAIAFDPPNKERAGVFPAYLAIQRPLVTNAVPARVVAALKEEGMKRRRPRARYAVDTWDKRAADPREWLQQLDEDLASGTNTPLVWTSIPDWVTVVLEREGYDGIHDIGGKMGGVEHDVWIPFDPTQVKSAIGNRGTFDPTSANSLKQGRRGSITISPDRTFAINLFENADPSTFLHETGHFFLELFADFADQALAIPEAERTPGQARIVSNWQAAMRELGVTERSQIGRPQHERWAASFEAYLMQGKAPSEELRPVFATFRNWLLGVYQVLKNVLNAKLTPELERVFDRLLASDEAIAAAERAAQIRPLFLTAEEAGMSPARFAAYRETLERAHQVAVERLDRTLMAEVAQEQTAAWRERKQRIRAEVAADVYQRPVYRAIAMIRKGTNPDGTPLVEGQTPEPLFLSRAAIVGQWSTERLATLPPFTYVNEGGLEPAVLADLSGFSSADELLTALADAAPMARTINAETDARMLAEHGSLLLSGELYDVAKENVTGDDRKVILREEIRALAAKRREVAPFVAVARQEGRQAVQAERDKGQAAQKELSALAGKQRGGAATIRGAVPNLRTVIDAAEEFVNRQQVKLLRPSLYWTAMRQAGKRALEAAARGEYDDAIQARTEELTAMARFEAASTALREVEARVKRARDLAKGPAQSAIGKASPADLAQINSILDRFDFATVPAKDVPPMEKYIAALEGDGMPIDSLPGEVRDNHRRQPYRELTYGELLGVTDGLQQLAHQARLRGKLLTAARNVRFADVRDRLVDRILLRPVKPAPLEFTPNESRKLAVSRLFAGHLKLGALAEMLDGERYGPVWEAIIRPLNAAADTEEQRKGQAFDAMQAIYARYFPGPGTRPNLSRLTDTVNIPGVGSLTREAMIAVALNWGNETSRQRLLADPSRQWNQGHVAAILDQLEAHEWQFVQATWDQLNTYWPEIADKQERITGIKPEKVQAAPVTTKFGELRGGYYPLVYDGRLAPRAFAHEAALEGKTMQMGAYMSSTTRRGHTEARKRNVHLPVKLELTVINNHVEQVLHDLTHHETLIDVNRLMKDAKVAKAVYDHAGPAVYQQFVEGFQAIAVGNAADRNAANGAFAYIRTGTQVALLGWNLWTALQQPLGLFNGAETVGVKWVAKGLGRWLRDTATMDSTVAWISSASPFMASRHTTQSQDIAQLRQTLTQEGSYFHKLVSTLTGDRLTQQTILDGFLWHIAVAQRVADVPTWLGQYEKSMASDHDEATAIAHADQAVIDSQGSGLMKDLANVQRGNAIAKIFLTFYSYGSTTLNRAAVILDRTRLSSPASVAKGLTDLGLVYVFPAMATVALANAVGRRHDDDDKDGALAGYLKAIAGETLGAALNGIVLAREAAGAAKLALGLDPGQRGYEGPAGTRAIATLYKLAGQVNQGEVDEALLKAANQVAGILIGYPSQQLERTVEGAVALADGTTHNPLALLFGPERKAQ